MTDTHSAMTTPASDPIFIAPNYDPCYSKTQNAIFPALFALQNELDPIKKAETNQHLRATYADLKAVWAAIREPLKMHGLLVLQEPHPDPRGAKVSTTVVHVESGEWRRSTLFVPSLAQMQKASGTSEYTAQGHGSALTYCRKYSLLTVLGLCTEDDDGHAASTTPRPQAERASTVGDNDRKGWEAWAQGKTLQLLGTDTLEALGLAWNGMQPELKKAPDDIRTKLIENKDAHKTKLGTAASNGEPGADVPF